MTWSRPSTSRPASHPHRPCGAPSTSIARTPATTRRGCTTPSTSSGAMRPTATTPCRCTRPPAMGASGIRSRSRSTSTTGSTSATPFTSTSRRRIVPVFRTGHTGGNMKTGVGNLRIVRALFAASAAPAALLFGVTATASAGTLDQQQTSFGEFTNGGINSSQSLGQTFTAGITGNLDQADLMLSNFASPPDPVTIEIRNTAGGLPGTSVLASSSIPSSAIPDDPNPAFVSATFGTPASVTAGTLYALVAWSTNTTGSPGWYFQQGTDPYPGGTGLNSQASPPAND